MTARAAAALVLALFATPAAAPQAGDAVAAEPVLRWRLDTTTPFVWQAVTAVLELVAPAPLPLTGPPRVEPAAGLDLQPLPAGDGIEALAGTDRFVIPVARYRLTARTAGRTTLPAARAAVGGTERTAGAVRLDVRPVADPIAATRAVGAFDRAVAFRWLGADAGELTVEVTGSGSVPLVEHPLPEVRGGSIVDTAQEVDEAGARKRWRYRLRAGGGGALSVVVPALPYLRLPDGEPAQIGAQPVALPPACRRTGAGGAARGRRGPLRRGAGVRPAARLPGGRAARSGRQPLRRRRHGGRGPRPARRAAAARLAGDAVGARRDRGGDRADRPPPRRGHRVAAAGAVDRRPARRRRGRGRGVAARNKPPQREPASRPRAWPRCCWPRASRRWPLRAAWPSGAWP